MAEMIRGRLSIRMHWQGVRSSGQQCTDQSLRLPDLTPAREPTFMVDDRCFNNVRACFFFFYHLLQHYTVNVNGYLLVLWDPSKTQSFVPCGGAVQASGQSMCIIGKSEGAVELHLMVSHSVCRGSIQHRAQDLCWWDTTPPPLSH